MILYKDGMTTRAYADLAVYANANNCTIVDKGDYLETEEIVIPTPTDEEQKQARANAYVVEVDPIQSHIDRLKDGEVTDEVSEELVELRTQRDEKREDIQERFPYSGQPEGTEDTGETEGSDVIDDSEDVVDGGDAGDAQESGDVIDIVPESTEGEGNTMTESGVEGDDSESVVVDSVEDVIDSIDAVETLNDEGATDGGED